MTDSQKSPVYKNISSILLAINIALVGFMGNHLFDKLDKLERATASFSSDSRVNQRDIERLQGDISQMHVRIHAIEKGYISRLELLEILKRVEQQLNLTLYKSGSKNANISLQ